MPEIPSDEDYTVQRVRDLQQNFVQRMRASADRIEGMEMRPDTSARPASSMVGEIVSEIMSLMSNLQFYGLVNAATEADIGVDAARKTARQGRESG